MEKPWFQDTKTGCEKQAHYFVQIRKLQDELIHREQHNLINAMERLKQLTYPRKRPMIRNFETTDHSRSSAQHFPARNLNLRKEAKHKALSAREKPELSPVSGKPLMRKSTVNRKQETYHHFFVMPPLLSDRDIAKIVHNANATFPSEPSTYLLQPHLPSIPNVGRKTNFMVDNRLKLLTLTESEFCDPEDQGSINGTRKYLHSEKSQRGKKTPKSKSRLDMNPSKENLTKKSETNVLTFDVDPNDPTLFSYSGGDKNVEEQYETTPLPPPNSRPSSAKSKSSHVRLEATVHIGSVKETSKENGTVSGELEGQITERNDENDALALDREKMIYSCTEDGKIDVKDMLSYTLVEGAGLQQDGSESIINGQAPAEIVQSTVTVTSKQASSEEDGS